MVYGLDTQDVPKFFHRLSWEESGDVPKAHLLDFYPERPDKLSEFDKQRLIAKSDLSGHSTSAEERLRIAMKLVDDKLSTQYVENLYADVLNQVDFEHHQKPITVHLPLSVRDTNLDKTSMAHMSSNMVSIVFAMKLNEQLNALSEARGDDIHFVTDRRLIRLTKDEKFVSLGRANADTIGRFVKQSRYDGAEVREGDYILLTDDHVHSGGVMKAMVDAVSRQHGKLVGIAAFGGMPECGQIRPTFDVDVFLDKVIAFNGTDIELDGDAETARRLIESTLHMVGLSIHSLTTREILSVATLFLDGRIPEQKAFFDEYCAQAGVNPNITESANDSLQEQLMKPAITPSGFQERIVRCYEELTKAMEGNRAL